MTTETENRARDQAGAEMDSIAEMVAALSCDYTRLETLKDEREVINTVIALADQDSAERLLHQSCLTKWDTEHGEELADLSEQAGGCESEDDARQRIDEDPLSVEVRSGWASLGATLEPEEFCILLCTGGPAVRIRGDLDQYRQPCRAWLEYQDWGTPWTEYYGENFDAETLLQYCQQFYFGD